MTVTLWIILGLVIWFGYGFVAAGACWAKVTVEYKDVPVEHSIGFIHICCIFGVIAFICNLPELLKYGWKKWW